MQERSAACWSWRGWGVVLDLKDSTGPSLEPIPPRHFESSREKKDEGVLCSLPHTLLQQALLGLVGLRMEHDDRQKQSSAPPCAAAFSSAGA